MARSTLKDIAAVAGVNVSTVSRVLSGASGVGCETRKNILRIAKEQGYGRRKKRLRTRMAGILVPELQSQYYTALAGALGACMSAKGYVPSISLSEFDSAQAAALIRSAADAGLRGVVCCTETGRQNGTPETWTVLRETAESCGIPVVFIADGAIDALSRFDQICLNERLGMEQLIDYFVSLGHRQIAFIGDRLSGVRLQHFQKIIRERGLDDSLVFIGENRFEQGGFDRMTELLCSPVRPTAVISAYDQLAAGAIRAVRDAKLRVPEDLSIAGFDNIAADDYFEPRLTSVTNPVQDMAEIAVRLLCARLSDSGGAVQFVALQPELVIRDSVRAVGALFPEADE